MNKTSAGALLKRTRGFLLDAPLDYTVKRVREMMEEPLSNAVNHFVKQPLVHSIVSMVATKVHDAYEVGSQIQNTLTTSSLVRPMIAGLENTFKSVVDSVSGLDASVIPNNETLLLVGTVAAFAAGTAIVMHEVHEAYDRCNKEESVDGSTSVSQRKNEPNVDQSDAEFSSSPTTMQEVELIDAPLSPAISEKPSGDTNTLVEESAVSTQLLVDNPVSTPASFSPSSDYVMDNITDTEEKSSSNEVEVVNCDGDKVDEDKACTDEVEKLVHLRSRSTPVECISLID